MSTLQRPYDVIVFGATGFTGRLVARYLSAKYPVHHQDAGDDTTTSTNTTTEHSNTFRWAIAGRSQERLQAIKHDLRLSDNVGIEVADTQSDQSLQRLAASTRYVQP
jgi:short subunit dehydrogenase-like uncharacterized protein